MLIPIRPKPSNQALPPANMLISFQSGDHADDDFTPVEVRQDTGALPNQRTLTTITLNLANIDVSFRLSFKCEKVEKFI